MDGAQLRQGYRATTRRQFAFYHYLPGSSYYSSDRTWKDKRVIRPWSHPVVPNPGPLDWKSNALTIRNAQIKSFFKTDYEINVYIL